MVLVKREPNSGTPSTSGYDMFVTLPVWISAASALVTGGVTRLVAPVWSLGPHGEGFTIDLQSLCANATGLDDKAIRAKADISVARSMVETPPLWFDVESGDQVGRARETGDATAPRATIEVIAIARQDGGGAAVARRRRA